MAKGKKKISPSTKTLRALEYDGWLADEVERRITRTLKKDLFGCIDIIAVKGTQTLAIQATSRSNVSARVKKVRESGNLEAMKAANWAVEVWGWGDNGLRRVAL